MRLAVTALALSLALGCGADPAPEKKGGGKTPDAKGTPGTPTPAPATPDDPKAAAQKFVADLFAALKARTATPDQLTADFKRLVAPPLGPDDAARGYSDERAKDFLDKWAAVKADDPKAELAGEAGFAAGKPGPGGRVLVRLAKDGGAWKVDWLSNGPATATDAKLDGGEDTAGVQFTAAAFADAGLTKDYGLVAGLMTAKGREAVAPPFAEADKARGYNVGLFSGAVGKAFGKADRAAVAGTSRSGNEATVPLTLTAGPSQTVLVLKLVKGAKPGVWLVDGFEVK